MATCSSILAWEIPLTEEPGGLYSPWGHRVKCDWATKQQQIKAADTPCNQARRRTERTRGRGPAPSLEDYLQWEKKVGKANKRKNVEKNIICLKN